jgi:hypothetical protein
MDPATVPRKSFSLIKTTRSTVQVGHALKHMDAPFPLVDEKHWTSAHFFTNNRSMPVDHLSDGPI